jgi:Trypsin-like peptidase domain
MATRRTLFFACLLATAASASGFGVGVFQARRATAMPSRRAIGTAGTTDSEQSTSHDALVAEVKKQIAVEMGLLPVNLLRDRRASFVELYSYDKAGKTHYGTAGYLGNGYFITVKHAVVALSGEDGSPASPIQSVKVMYKGEEIPTRVIDTGDAKSEVHRGDWAIIRGRDLDLPALRVDTAFKFDFADPIFRLGNDYSRGIIVSTGYVGQRTDNGLVTCLIDGHPGVSGGGVLNQRGDLVGIPVGRLDGDYRFSFLLPIREEMLRKVQREST